MCVGNNFASVFYYLCSTVISQLEENKAHLAYLKVVLRVAKKLSTVFSVWVDTKIDYLFV